MDRVVLRKVELQQKENLFQEAQSHCDIFPSRDVQKIYEAYTNWFSQTIWFGRILSIKTLSDEFRPLFWILILPFVVLFNFVFQRISNGNAETILVCRRVFESYEFENRQINSITIPQKTLSAYLVYHEKSADCGQLEEFWKH